MNQFTDLVATIQTFKHLNPFQMRRAVRDYRYEVGEDRMTEECSQYLAQLQKDWERQRVKLGVEVLRKSVKCLSPVSNSVLYRSRLPITEKVTLISMMERHPPKRLKRLKRLKQRLKQLLSLNPTRLLHKNRSITCSRERLIDQNGCRRNLLQSLGNSLIPDICYRFSFHPTRYIWVRYPSWRRGNTSRTMVVKEGTLDRRALTAVEVVRVVWNGRQERENSEWWGRRYSVSWASPYIQVADGNGPQASSKSETRPICRARLAAKWLTRRRMRPPKRKRAREQSHRN